MRATGRDVRRRGSSGRRALAVGIVALASLAAAGCNKFKSKQLIREGNANFKQQQYEQALELYKKAHELDPNEIRLEKFVAMGYMALYNPGSTHPKDIEALNNSIDHFKKYLAAEPDDEKAAKYLVTTYLNAQKHDEAIGYFKEWTQSHPTDAQAVQTIAMLYAKKGDFEQSMEWQKKHAAMEPTKAEVWYTMGVTAWDKSYNTGPDSLPTEQRVKILDDGMNHLKKAIELNPDYYEAMFYVNLLYREYAKLEADPTKVAELKAQADEWQKKGLEIRRKVMQKQREEQAAKNPLEAL